MKRLIAITLTAFSTAAFSAEEYVSPITGRPIPNDGKYTVEQIRARDERVLKKTGGFVEVVAKGTSVVVLDTREKPAGAPIQFADVFGSLSKTNVRAEKSTMSDGETAVSKATALIKNEKVGYVIVVVDDAVANGLSIYPEERVAVVNAGKYKGSNNDILKPEERVHKELWRALGFVSGVGYAPFDNDVLQPVFTINELDALKYQVMQPMNFQKMYSTLSKLGVTRARRVPYRIAVQEGWAAQPTNDYQKAVWEQVHSIPDKPLKIEYDPKVDK